MSAPRDEMFQAEFWIGQGVPAADAERMAAALRDETVHPSDLVFTAEQQAAALKAGVVLFTGDRPLVLHVHCADGATPAYQLTRRADGSVVTSFEAFDWVTEDDAALFGLGYAAHAAEVPVDAIDVVRR